jgi:hypothetical protein
LIVLLGFLGFYDAAFSAAGVAEFAQCTLVISLSYNRGLVIADVEHNVATPWREPWEPRETRGVR